MRLLVLVILPLLDLVRTSRYNAHWPYNDEQFNCTYGDLKGNLTYKQCYFPQKIDHFGSANNQHDYWFQLFYLRKDFYNKNSKTIFIFVGGEVPLGPDVLREEWCSHYGNRSHALCIYLQHRFYGPTKPSEIEKDNAKLLSTTQALEDVNNFIVKSKKTKVIPEDAKVIVFGCSYSGTLAAWLRLKYPDQVQGAISTSAPLLAKSFLPEFGEHVKKTLNSIDPECFPKIKLTLQTFMFVCSWINLDFCKDSSTVVYEINNNLYYGQLFHTFGVEAFCQNISDLDYFARLENIHNFTRPEPEWFRTWLYQACNELGWFPTSNLGLGIDYWTERCQDIMGQEWNLKKLDLQVDKTNKRYYGELRGDISNVVFIHGEDDIWKSLGLFDPTNKSVDFLIVEDERHCPKLDKKHIDTIEKHLSQWIGRIDE